MKLLASGHIGHYIETSQEWIKNTSEIVGIIFLQHVSTRVMINICRVTCLRRNNHFSLVTGKNVWIWKDKPTHSMIGGWRICAAPTAVTWQSRPTPSLRPDKSHAVPVSNDIYFFCHLKSHTDPLKLIAHDILQFISNETKFHHRVAGEYWRSKC